jgi:ABC-type transport system involved in multi-copper enzyme maturation permease subunit
MTSLRAALAVAVMTFREAVRDRVLYLLLAFALVMIATSRLLALLTVGSEARIVADTGLAAIAFFGVLTGVVVGVSLITKEIEQRTAYTILARPLTRRTFVVGKYLGLLTTVVVNAAVMSVGFVFLLLWRGEPVVPMLPALWLIAVELAVITALALFFSAVSTSSILGILFTLAIYIAGHLVWSFPLLARRLAGTWGATAVMAVYHVMPNLDRFNVRGEAVHGDPVSLGFLLAQTAYGAGWAILLVLAAALAFSRRDLA